MYIGDNFVEDMLLAGKYMYMSHLRTLNNWVPCFPASLPASLMMINSTPLVTDERHLLLGEHPDREFVDYLVQGMVDVFCIGFNYGLVECKSAKWNMLSLCRTQP